MYDVFRFSWLSLCMHILVRLSSGDILVYTPSVSYNCDTIGYLYVYMLCILWLNKYMFLHRQWVIIVIQVVFVYVYSVYFVVKQIHGYDTVTQCFMYGVWLVWCIHDGFSLYGYRCLSSQQWIYADRKVLHHLYIFIEFCDLRVSDRSGRLHCVIVYLHTYSLSHFDVVSCLKSQIWIYMLRQHLRYPWSSH